MTLSTAKGYEARALRTVLRKIVDDPHDANIGASGLRRQRIGETCFCAPRRGQPTPNTADSNDQRDAAASRAGDRGTRFDAAVQTSALHPDEGAIAAGYVAELHERLYGGNARQAKAA